MRFLAKNRSRPNVKWKVFSWRIVSSMRSQHHDQKPLGKPPRGIQILVCDHRPSWQTLLTPEKFAMSRNPRRQITNTPSACLTTANSAHGNPTWNDCTEWRATSRGASSEAAGALTARDYGRFPEELVVVIRNGYPDPHYWGIKTVVPL